MSAGYFCASNQSNIQMVARQSSSLWAISSELGMRLQMERVLSRREILGA